MGETVRRLSAFPRGRLGEVPMLRGSMSELSLLERLGPPTSESPPRLSAPPRFFWDLEYPCGLVLSVELDRLAETVSVHIDLDDVEHALRHLGPGLVDVERVPGASGGGAPRGDGQAVERDAELWWVGGGEERRVAAGLTRRDAECRLDEAGYGHEVRLRPDPRPGR